jgi:tRNA-modifying protein YgfZ
MNTAGYEARRSRAAWLDLSGRGVIIAAGEDRARLLHALCTNDIEHLKRGEQCYAFFLNAQGRILADANILCRAEDFLIDTEPETRASLYQHIEKYIIADDVALDDASDRLAVIALEGPEALAMAATMDAARLTFTGAPGVRFFVPRDQKAELIAQLEKAGAVEADADAARVVRLEHAKPRYGEEISEKYLAQETQQMHALSFSKGCYLGQEIVERVRSRGLVHRLLVGLSINSNDVPAPGTPVVANGVEIGKLAGVALSPALGTSVAMAYVRREQADPGTKLLVNGRVAEVRPLFVP